MREGYVDFIGANHDLFDEAFNDLALVFGWQGRPAVVERAGFMEKVIGGEFVHFEEINLGLEFRQFGHQLVQPFLGGFVELSKALRSDLAV